MNSRREHRKQVYNDLYKKYLSLTKKTYAQSTRNRLLHSTNSELSKELIKLKEEIRKCSSINTNLKTEIYDFTVEKKHLMHENRGLYNTLTTLHNDNVTFEKMISQLLNSLDPEIKASELNNRCLIPKVNGEVIKNPRDNIQLPETSYQRYNFKDFIYIQDLSPIMEENAEVKKLIKPADITRRLGHRAKVPHPDKCSENVEVTGSVFNEDSETNILKCSPSSARLQDSYKEIKNVEKQSMIVEEEIIPNVGVSSGEEILSSPSGCNESNNMTADESILSPSLPNHSERQHTTIFKNENDGLSPLLTINVVPPPDSESTSNDKDFHSSLFANVFPRRRMINNKYSLSPGSVAEESNEEPNSMNFEKEYLSPMVSTNSLKNGLDQSSVRIESDSFLKSNLTTSNENISDMATEMSHQEESIIETTYLDFQRDIKTIAKDIECGMETYATALDSFHEKLESSPKLVEETIIEDREISISSFKKMSDDSSIGCSSVKQSSKILSQGSNAEGRASLPRQCSKKSSLNNPSKSVQEKKSDVKPLSKSADRNSVKSSKRITPGRKSVEDTKKTLRPKKPFNFSESPVKKINHKRKQMVEKFVK